VILRRHRVRVVQARGRDVDLAGRFGTLEVSGVPQRPQNVRRALGVESNPTGVPATSRKSARRTLNQATKGAPLVRRQMEQ
jgi:hypothetical protein